MRLFRPLAALLLLSTVARAHDHAAPQQARTVAEIRAEAQAVVLVQSVLSWYTRTVGETSIQAETYRGHEALFSKRSFDTVAAAAKGAGGNSASDDRRALGFLKSYLAGEFLNQAIARFDDEAQNAELAATVRLSWEKAPVPYKQLDLLSADEKDGKRRAEIESRKAEVWKSTLNPILERKEKEAQRLARELGYPSYVALAEEFRIVDLRPLTVEGERFRKATDALYAELLAEVAKKELGLLPKDLHRSDIGRLRKAPRFQKFFPKELMIPSFRHFLDGIGMDLRTAAGGEVKIDDALHPQKEPRAACYSIRVPGDIRITVKPTGGIDDFVTFFHEGGHALHYANTTSKVWEFQQLGPYAITESFAETFGHVWDDPAWLRRYRAFVIRWNGDHKTAFPTMSDGEILEVVRLRVFEEIYFLRRYGSAKLIYEAALHGGDPAIWKGVYPGQTADLQGLYKDLFGRAYGFALSDEDALRYRTDVDDFFYAADYTRAFGLANLIHEGVRTKIGPEWLTSKASGELFRKLFSDGNRLQPDEVAQQLGYAKLDFTPSEARFSRLLATR
ncbi:MAG: hypothetical protein EXR72_21535 [Myxococcales bacterium]|nr:hypothetical protein [Myxococcales bacterium]